MDLNCKVEGVEEVGSFIVTSDFKSNPLVVGITRFGGPQLPQPPLPQQMSKPTSGSGGDAVSQRI